jgi:alpha-glucosidase
MLLTVLQGWLLTLLTAGPLIPTSTRAQSVSATTSYSSQFTVPSSADFGLPVIPSVQDPEAPNPQASCPGYTASNIQNEANGFTADLQLAGQPCNVFGTDIENLKLTVEFQNDKRLNVNIQPAVLVSDNKSLSHQEFADQWFYFKLCLNFVSAWPIQGHGEFS